MDYSIRDIAKMAGVSIGTVSRVLNNAGNVDETIRSRTLEIIRSVNYKHTSRGRRTGKAGVATSGGKTRTLALLSPGMSSEWKENDLWASYFSGIEQACQERRYQLMIYMADSAETEEEILKDVLRKSDGVLLKLEQNFPDYVKKLIDRLPAAGFGARPCGEALPQVVLNNTLAGEIHYGTADRTGTPQNCISQSCSGEFHLPGTRLRLSRNDEGIWTLRSGSAAGKEGRRGFERNSQTGNSPATFSGRGPLSFRADRSAHGRNRCQ